MCAHYGDSRSTYKHFFFCGGGGETFKLCRVNSSINIQYTKYFFLKIFI